MDGHNNPHGVDPSVFDEMTGQMKEDRIGFLESFGKKFLG
jgi:non-heme chloroperoxidase